MLEIRGDFAAPPAFGHSCAIILLDETSLTYRTPLFIDIPLVVYVILSPAMGKGQQKNKKNQVIAVESKPYGLTANLRKVLLPLLILLIIVLLIFGIYRLVRHNSNQSLDNTACSSSSAGSVLQNASVDLTNQYYTQLIPTVKQIKALPNYQKDPNCMYVITAYNIAFGYSSQAKTSLDQFNQAYSNSGNKLDTALLKYESIDTLRKNAASVEANNQQLEKNSKVLSQPYPTVKSKK